MTRRRTRGEAQIEALLQRLEPGSERHKILTAARDFKASWVALGERLTVAREQQLYKQWGYPSFEAYCRNELRIKGETANKLTRSYAFLRDHEPQVLSEPVARELPALEVVDLLSRAREKAKISDEQFQALHQGVFAEETPPSRNDVIKRLREFDPDAFRPAPRQVRTVEGGDVDLRKALLLAERLESLVDPHPDLSPKARDGLKKLISELRALFEATRKSA